MYEAFLNTSVPINMVRRSLLHYVINRYLFKLGSKRFDAAHLGGVGLCTVNTYYDRRIKYHLKHTKYTSNYSTIEDNSRLDLGNMALFKCFVV